MKDKNLLDMMGNIEDSFIEEAAHPEILLKKKRKPRFLSVSKLGTIAACMVIAIGMVVAVPYMRISKEDAIDPEAMNSAIQQAIEQVNSAQAEKDAAIASSLAADKIAQAQDDAAIAASIAAEKAVAEAAEAAKKAAEAEAARKAAEKAAAERDDASKKAQEEAAAAISKVSITTNNADAKADQEISAVAGTTPSVHETTSAIAETVFQTSFENVTDDRNGLSFAWRDHVLYEVKGDTDSKIVNLIIPETLAGEPIIEISDDFWNFYSVHKELKTITIPKTIEKFGDVSELGKSVVIICSADSPAAEFFTQAGYSVQTQS